MLEIDGSYGSGGGQILRTATGFSALTSQPCRITNIRAKRKNPGLQEQHLQAIRAVCELVDGKLEGAEIGSTSVCFYPAEIKKEKLKVKISTAGSVGLVLQALMITALKHKKLVVEIEGGGTFGKWAPPTLYSKYVLSPLLEKFGFSFNVNILRDGFYPKGGAYVVTEFAYTEPKRIELVEKGNLIELRGISVATKDLQSKNVAERQRDSAIKILKSFFNAEPSFEVKYVDVLCSGSGILIYVVADNTIIGSDSLGERGKSSEKVGEEAATQLIKEFENGVVDSFMADQILPFIAFAGGKVLVSEVTEHCFTNAYIIEKFLPVKFQFENKLVSVI